jgi:hypothetical protein
MVQSNSPAGSGGTAGLLTGASPPGAPGFSGLSFLAQNGAEGKGTLTRRSSTIGMAPSGLVTASSSSSLS